MKIKLTINQANAIRAQNALAQSLMNQAQAVMVSQKNHTDAIVRDHGEDPDKFERFDMVQEGDNCFMVLLAKPEAAPNPPESKA